MTDLGQHLGTIPVTEKPEKVKKIENAQFPTPHPLSNPQVPPVDDIKAMKQYDEIQKAQGKTEEEIQLDKKFDQAKKDSPEDDFIVIQAGDHDKTQTVVSIDEANKELVHVKSTWPFDYFPAEIIVYAKRIVIRNQLFFFSTAVDTFLIDTISLVEVHDSILFSSMYIAPLNQPGITVNWLKPQDARRCKAIIDALLLEERGKIKLNETDIEKKADLLEKVGNVSLTA